MMPHEEYKLMLIHEFVDSNGGRHELEMPIAVKQTIPISLGGVPNSYVASRMMDEMKARLTERVVGNEQPY